LADLNKNQNDLEQLRLRLHRAIPGGSHTYSRGDDQFPSIAPPLLVRGKGAYTWDSVGRRYLDYGMALRAVTLGYADERVNAAAILEMENGVNLTRASLTELYAAEKLIELIPSVEMVKFGKNGSNVTTAAVKIARAYTNRRYVCVPRQQPFFSFDDWFISTTPITRGIPLDQTNSTLVFDYNNIDSLQTLFSKYPGEIAAVMLEPATAAIPCPISCGIASGWPSTVMCANCNCNKQSFLQKVRSLCDNNGTLLIFDEMITGFRWHLQGAQVFFGVQPDITTFGKAMANGFSVAAVGGRRDVMEVGAINKPGMERTFLLSTTHGAEMTGLGAFMATVDIYRNEDVVGHLWSYGNLLKTGMTQVIEKHRLSAYFQIEGPPISLSYVTRDINEKISFSMRTLFMQELCKQGIIMPWISFSQAHGEIELRKTIDALDTALEIYVRALNDGVEKILKGSSIRPVFRTHN
jgi:glutamate-1-semialdehyde 2,1-aminomutase